MNPALLAALERSAARVLPPDGSRDAAFGARFYEVLFDLAPATRALFPDDLAAQRVKLVEMLRLVVRCARRPDDLLSVLAQLGERHTAYGARPEHYRFVGIALLRTLEEVGALDATERRAWDEAYTLIANVMREVARVAPGLQR